MINKELEQQLRDANSSDQFTQIAQANGLKVFGGNGVGFTALAWEEGDYDNRICSKRFCPACGTADLPRSTLQCKTEYCTPCGIKFGEVDPEEVEEISTSIFNDPFLNSNQDVPHRVTQGEMHDDRMAIFNKEY